MTDTDSTKQESSNKTALILRFGGVLLAFILLVFLVLPVAKDWIDEVFKSDADKIQQRDEQREKDIRLIQSAIHNYKLDKEFYPSSEANSPYISSSDADTDIWITSLSAEFLPFDSEKGEYLIVLPKDPTNTPDFIYRYKTSKPPAADYELNVFFENDEDNLSTSDSGNNKSVYEVGTDLKLIE